MDVKSISVKQKAFSVITEGLFFSDKKFAGTIFQLTNDLRESKKV